MSNFIQLLRDFNVKEDALTKIQQLANNIESACSNISEKKAIAEQLMNEFSIDEPTAIFYAYKSNSLEEAAALMFATIKPRYPRNSSQTINNSNINVPKAPEIFAPELDQTSTTSIYIAGPGVRIDGKSVINTDRDTANSLLVDWFGNKPLDPTKVSTYPLFIVDDPTVIEYNCRICMEEYKVNDSVLMVTPCYHYFHQSCITEFFKYKNVCPIDNVEL